MDIMGEKGQKTPSEFSENGYEVSVLFSALSTMLDEKFSEDKVDFEDNETSITITAERFSQHLTNELVRRNLVSIKDNVFFHPDFSSVKSFHNFSDFAVIDTNTNKSISVEGCINELSKAHKNVISAISKENKYFDILLASDYLEKYYHTIKSLVFSPNNRYLYWRQFRRSKLVNSLNCMELTELKILPNNVDCQIKQYDCFTVVNPFAYDVVRRIITRFNSNFEGIAKSKVLFKFKKHIYLRQVERAFTRFTSYNKGTSYRVSLNRHKTELISCEYDKLSSISEFKPIRLMEKIFVYINTELARIRNDNHSNSIDINICIIGHTEPSSNGDERELLDLLNAVLGWYERSSFELVDTPSIIINIKNLVSESDISVIVQEERTGKKHSIIRGKNKGTVEIISCNFDEMFAFSTIYLKQYCNENDLVFVLDCPWLTAENYEIKNNGSLDIFCNELQTTDFNIELFDRFDNKLSTIMEDISTHLNRITSSDTTNSGKIARTFKDSIIKNIESFVGEREIKDLSQASKQKSIFIFTSETDGINLSYLSDYPLTREEMYEGKSATIIGFTNKTIDTLSVSDNKKARFQIRFWSVLKYTSISYAFIEVKNDINKCFNSTLNEELYFEILRDIILCFDIDVSGYIVNIFINYSDRIDKVFRELDIDLETSAVIKQKLFEEIKAFVQALYTTIVFSEKAYDCSFGNDFIKDAFEMNVYSAANDVQTMIFLNQYRFDRMFGDQMRYNVFVADSYEKINDDNYNKDFFKDKKLYETVLDSFNYSDWEDDSLEVAFLQSKNVYGKILHQKQIIKNIITALEKLGMSDTEIYENAMNALQ